MEENLQWKRTFDGRQSSFEDNLGQKTKVLLQENKRTKKLYDPPFTLTLEFDSKDQVHGIFGSNQIN